MKIYEYTANDEIPECGRCDQFDGSYGLKCKEWCGSEHGWLGYIRTEMVDNQVYDIVRTVCFKSENE